MQKLYNFDQFIDRRNTASIKYDARMFFFNKEDIVPMWIADMDFKTPDFILDAIRGRLDHEILGYSFQPDSFFNAIITWNQQRHGWHIQKDWIAYAPRIIPAINLMVLSFTTPGDKIIVQPPVYYPFFSVVKNHGRELLFNPLLYKDGQYRFDFANLVDQIDSRTKMLILSNPHNPCGRVWTKAELQQLAEICLKNNIIIISDEAHSDLILPGNKHTVLASISNEISANVITCMSPSKAFNLSGLSTAYIVSSNLDLITRYKQSLQSLHGHSGNIFGDLALQAAYNNGADWLDQLIGYCQENINVMQRFIFDNLPQLRIVKSEGTYMVWLDFNAFNLSDDEIQQKLIFEAGLGLNHGPVFGSGGKGFQRMNIACSRKVLLDALNKICNAFKKTD